MPQCAGLVFQEAHEGTRVSDGLILDVEGGGERQKHIDAF